MQIKFTFGFSFNVLELGDKIRSITSLIDDPNSFTLPLCEVKSETGKPRPNHFEAAEAD